MKRWIGLTLVACALACGIGDQTQKDVPTTNPPAQQPTPPASPTDSGAVAVIQGGGSDFTAPVTLGFDGSSSYSTTPHSMIADWAWNFGDGATARGAHVSHTFSAGNFTVTLTVIDSEGARASSSKVVAVSAPPPGSIRWARSVPGLAGVGGDFGARLAVSYGLGPNRTFRLQRIDPRDGTLLWDVPESTDLTGTHITQGGVPLVSPATGEIFSIAGWPGLDVHESACGFSPGDGALDGCFATVDGEYAGMNAFGMGAAGDIAIGAWGAGAWVWLRRADGTVRRIQLTSEADPGFSISGVSVEPGGDVVISGFASGNIFDGVSLPWGAVLMRVSPEGHLVWSRPVPQQFELGTTASGTIIGTTMIPETGDTEFGSTVLTPGIYLLETEADGTPRFARKLTEKTDDFTSSISVSPDGDVAVLTHHADLNQTTVYRFDPAGNVRWQHEFPRAGGPFVTGIGSVAILPDDVVIAGGLWGAYDFGTGTLPPGGFVVDLRG